MSEVRLNMGDLIENLRIGLPSKKILDWSKLVFLTGASQIGIQAIGFISGILIIRFLTLDQYAMYTLANTVLGTMIILSDGGISIGITSIGGKVWKNREKLGSVLSTGLHLRHKFAIGSLVISLPILAYLLFQHEASWLTILLICLAIIPAFYGSLSDSLLVIIPKLHQCILPIQRNSAKVELGRLFLIFTFIIIFPFTYIVLFANGIPRVLGNIKLRKIAFPFADPSKPSDPNVKKEILAIVKRIMPGAIYFCITSQITIWIISFFGKTNAVAQIGALGRLSMFLVLIQYLIGTFLEPLFAKMELDKKIIIKRAIQVFVSLSSLVCIVVFAIFMLSKPVLWVLGDNYSELNYELVLSITGGGLALLGHTAAVLYMSRGWVLNPMILIGISIASIGLGAILFELSTLQGVLLFNIFLAVVQTLLHWLYFGYKIIRIED
jgi:O-antigen/teichoic acid export membrane protein